MKSNFINNITMFYASMFIAIFSIVIYQVLQKDISVNLNPMSSLIITYTVALISSIFLYFFLPSTCSLIDSFKNANYASYFLGIAIVGIEAGFLLIYRSGWDIGIATLFSSSFTNILLIVIGLIFFREYLTGTKIIGILFCMIGAYLINQK
jgi:drug/metabolite transporter (DMT)-like permease